MIKSQLVWIEALTDRDREAMFLLLSTHFDGVDSTVFQADLNGKNWVLLLKDENSGVLKGFSTLLLQKSTIGGEIINVVYSGDTIVDPSAWSSTMLPRAWIAAINFLSQQNNLHRLYWLFICSGFRTYRFLPVFWQEFYPCYNVGMPVSTHALMTHLATEYYGDRYQPELGIIRFDRPQMLKSDLMEIPIERQSNPHIKFFMHQNPGWELGDELVCLTEIKYDNLTAAGRRMWQSELPLEFS
jgi:hypothetical protein